MIKKSNKQTVWYIFLGLKSVRNHMSEEPNKLIPCLSLYSTKHRASIETALEAMRKGGRVSSAMPKDFLTGKQEPRVREKARDNGKLGGQVTNAKQMAKHLAWMRRAWWASRSPLNGRRHQREKEKGEKVKFSYSDFIYSCIFPSILFALPCSCCFSKGVVILSGDVDRYSS